MLRAAALTFVLLLPLTAEAAPKAELWERWAAHAPASNRTVDHSAWDAFLAARVVAGADGIHRIAYGRVPAAGRENLKAYITMLGAVPVSDLSRDEQRAYWINLYNALTVDVVLDHYPVESIRDIDISPGLFASGPWGRKFVAIEGEGVSLDDIEHRILRPIWKDARLHYAVNCASLGCPNLQARAFTATNAETLLDAAATAYVNHPRGANVKDGRLIVSSIYAWFEEDFGGTEAGVIAHLKRHAEPALRAALDGVTSIADDEYDWRLNDIR